MRGYKIILLLLFLAVNAFALTPNENITNISKSVKASTIYPAGGNGAGLTNVPNGSIVVQSPNGTNRFFAFGNTAAERGANYLLATNLARAGDIIRLGPGDFGPSSSMVVPPGVSLIGSGPNTVLMTNLSGSFSNFIALMTVKGGAVGLNMGQYEVYWEDLTVLANNDAALGDGVNSFKNCRFVPGFDGLLIGGTNTFENCVVERTNNTSPADYALVKSMNGKIFWYGGRVTSTVAAIANGKAFFTCCPAPPNDGEIMVVGTYISVPASDIDLHQQGGRLTVDSSTVFDAAKTFGTITRTNIYGYNSSPVVSLLTGSSVTASNLTGSTGIISGPLSVGGATRITNSLIVSSNATFNAANSAGMVRAGGYDFAPASFGSIYFGNTSGDSFGFLGNGANTYIGANGSMFFMNANNSVQMAAATSAQWLFSLPVFISGNSTSATHTATSLIAGGGGIASATTNATLTMAAGGITNTTTIQYTIYGFTGTGVVLTNLSRPINITLGTITAPATIVLQPNDALMGTLCSAAGDRGF